MLAFPVFLRLSSSTIMLWLAGAWTITGHDFTTVIHTTGKSQRINRSHRISCSKVEYFTCATADQRVPCHCMLLTQKWIVAYLDVALQEKTIPSDSGLSMSKDVSFYGIPNI